MAFALQYLLSFILFLILSGSTTAQISPNKFLGSSLTARNNDNSSWPSPSGEFAFGFRQMGKNGFLLAIWFNKIPERTIVWSANGDNLVAQGSKVELTSDGQFVLNDATGKELWNAESAITGVDHAAMLGTGNFVLADRNSTTLWGSFDLPTDTILPTQTLNQNSRLLARYSASNYSTGRFLFTLQSDGNLVLYTTNFPQDSTNKAYWSPNIADIGFQVIVNQSGHIYLTSSNGTILSHISSETVSMQDFYQRATLESDGVLRYHVYPKSSSSSAGRRPLVWSASSFIPPNICLSVSDSLGRGACGFNSLCRLDEQGPTCVCPKGYSFIDPNDVVKGCKQNFLPQSCDEASPETAFFEFQDMHNTDLQYADYELFEGVQEDWCRHNCLEDCFCAAAIFNTGRCFKKRLPFQNGRIDPSISGQKALIKFRIVNSSEKSAGRAKTERKDNSTLILVGSLLLGSSVVLNILLPLLSYLFGSKIYLRKVMEIQPYSAMPGMTLKYFSYEELKKATNEFKEELGRGASAMVFKGVLPSDEAKYAAMKRLDTKVGENDLEFKAEVMAIGRTNHRNLVQLFGFCNEGQHRILVYEFMSNGSLASFLFGDSRPNWYQRRQIALGIARGLLYLHEECSNQIVHCDIKPQNILLDDDFTARIADFGLAKLFRLDQTRTMTAIRGTKGYVAPEWFKSVPITVKVDVYSYGILLLEIIFCRKHFQEMVEDENEMILADWAYDCYRQKELHRIFKTDDEAMNDIKKMERYVMIALCCIHEDPSLRPTMKNVILMLEGTLEVPTPPDAYSFSSSLI